MARTPRSWVVLAVVQVLVTAWGIVSIVAPDPVRPPLAAPRTGLFAVEPIDTTVCNLTNDPLKFDRRVVRLHAFITIAMEQSTLHDPGCPDEEFYNMYSSGRPEPRIWMAFGPPSDYGVVVQIPRVHDEKSAALYAALSERSPIDQMTGATMVGTYFAGEVGQWNGWPTTQGFGHMGCCALFVLSRVESVDRNYADTLNYSARGPSAGSTDCFFSRSDFPVPDNVTLRAWQREANARRDPRKFDPRATAEDYLRRLRQYDAMTVSRIPADLLQPEVSGTTYHKRFDWASRDRSTHVVIQVARPYWLQTAATTASGVIWAPIRAAVMGRQPSSR